MTRYISKLRFALAFVLLALSVACTKVPVGYLHTSEANYRINTKVAYRQAQQGEDFAFSSANLEGLGGTQPISYAFHSVKVSEGGDEAAFLKVVKEGLLLVRGGKIQLLQKGASQLPVGKYTISIRVSNEGHEAILSDIFSFIVKEQPEEAEDTASSSNE